MQEKIDKFLLWAEFCAAQFINKEKVIEFIQKLDKMVFKPFVDSEHSSGWWLYRSHNECELWCHTETLHSSHHKLYIALKYKGNIEIFISECNKANVVNFFDEIVNHINPKQMRLIKSWRVALLTERGILDIGIQDLSHLAFALNRLSTLIHNIK